MVETQAHSESLNNVLLGSYPLIAKNELISVMSQFFEQRDDMDSNELVGSVKIESELNEKHAEYFDEERYVKYYLSENDETSLYQQEIGNNFTQADQENTKLMKHRVLHAFINFKPMIQKQKIDRLINSEDSTEKDIKFDMMSVVNMTDEIMSQTPGKIEKQTIIQVLIDETFFKYTKPFLIYKFVGILIG